MRVVVFTSSALRHKAFASMVSNSKNLEVVGVFHEQSRTLNEVIKNNQNIELQAQHLLARDQDEKDFFGLFLDNLTDNEKSQLVPRQWFSSSECIDTLEILRVDLILFMVLQLSKVTLLIFMIKNLECSPRFISLLYW